jgi:hypothetical protein
MKVQRAMQCAILASSLRSCAPKEWRLACIPKQLLSKIFFSFHPLLQHKNRTKRRQANGDGVRLQHLRNMTDDLADLSLLRRSQYRGNFKIL